MKNNASPNLQLTGRTLPITEQEKNKPREIKRQVKNKKETGRPKMGKYMERAGPGNVPPYIQPYVALFAYEPA